MKNHGRALRPVAVAAATGLVAVLASGAADASVTHGTGRPAGITARVPALKWKACHGGFQCATARVPLDYRHPGGAKISIALVRHLATDPARRVRSMFINTGGPGEQIEAFLSFYYPRLPAVLRKHFDIITFDPRGFGFSTAVRCFPDAAAEAKFLSGVPFFPVGAKQDAAWERTWARFDARCARTGGPLLDHDTTADVARDLNRLRAAAGDPVLNYLGASYGTGLGAVYANLFPSRVGRMILDANLNPVAWTTKEGNRSLSMRLGNNEAQAANLTAFLNLCGKTTTARCAFSAGTPVATRAKWNTLLRRLTAHRVTIGSPPQTVTYADAFTVVDIDIVSDGRQADIASDWQQGAVELQQLWAASARSNASPAAARAPITPAATPVYTGPEQELAAFCSDGPEPRKVSAYASDARLAFARSGGYGLADVWNDEQCARWPGNGAKDRYTGPWHRRTASPILLIGITDDAALPYRDDLAMAHDLARARLLTVRGHGHDVLNNPDPCVTNYEFSYLRTGALPKPGTVCKQEPPFKRPAA
jgi:pimeloyl-ACP methyl ester carboxylesterase